MISVSVIIPVKEINDYAREATQQVHSLFPACEILLIPDHDYGEKLPGTTVIASSPITTPGEKRDFAAQFASSEILAFLDDDAYPSEGWLGSALGHFDEKDVVAVGGPGVTPPSNNSRQRASGWALASMLGSGGSTYRFRSGRRRDVDDFPSMNFLIRRSDFLAVGGFNSPYWPGEDTELCRKLISDLDKRIVYEPEAVVYHHRRPVFRAHLRQQARYGLHRGYFARRFAGNSRRLAYAVPAVFTIGIVFGPIVALLSGLGMILYVAALGIYVGALIATGVWVCWHERNLWVVALALGTIFVTHIAYGVAYIKGLLSPELLH
ncbi:MAG: glycosyltransferase family 2 protein [Ferrimicrobium sp.]